MNYYIYRLIPPRPDFPVGITPEEDTAMEAHAAYWRKLTADGHVIAVGPVADPAGNYGIGILRLNEGIDATSFGADDPAISANLGFSFDVAPMMSIILPT